MNQEKFMTDLPSEIIINILSRLPVRTIITCKCVCKFWFILLNSREFTKSHLSKSKPGLVIYLPDIKSELFKIFEFEDSLDNLESHELHYNPVTKFDRSAISDLSNVIVGILGSVNGLLFLCERNTQPNALYICNPITQDHIQLPTPKDDFSNCISIVTYGFGVSKMSGKHKVMRILHECIYDPSTHKLVSIPKSVCQIYTLGTGSWRSITPGGAPLEYNYRSIGAFLNGNLHWLVSDLKGSLWISCFDLQTEVFTTFSPPPDLPGKGRFIGSMVMLEDCLCLCDNSSGDEIVIWLMKEYGVEKSWKKEYVVRKIPNYFAAEYYQVVYPIKVFKNGDILMAWEDFQLFYYSNKTNNISLIRMFQLRFGGGGIQAMLYTPSFLSLNSLRLRMQDQSHFERFHLFRV